MIAEWLAPWFDGLSDADRRRMHALAWCGALYAFHYAWFCGWYVEDSAISFSYARNAADGHGFVAMLGGERIEGFSNPTWTLLLAAFDACGLSPWPMAKMLGLVLGLATLPLAQRWARELMPHRDDLLPSLAPLFLAVSPQFATWNASGLENSLFSFLLAAGAVGMVLEAKDDRTPWSGLAWGLLAITRPEAPLYAVAAFPFGFTAVAVTRGPRAALAWSWRWMLIALPLPMAWMAWKWVYFAWLFPNTYYAKLGQDGRFEPFEWDRKGWLYVRNYALDTGQGFILPLYIFAATGIARWRGLVGSGGVLLGLMVSVPGLAWLWSWSDWEEPQTSVILRIVVLSVLAVLLPVLGLGRGGSAGRSLAFAQGGIAVFFAIYSGGDWMHGYRWLSMAAVPMAVLLADAVGEVGSALRQVHRVGPVVAGGIVVAASFVLGLTNTWIFLNDPEVTPYDVRRRVLYMQEVQKRLGIERVALMDVDMGAHMWWSDFEMVDMAGLVDVPMAHHRWEKPFVREYVYGEQQPEFAHVHASWASKTKMRSHTEWSRYLEIPGYPSSPWSFHVGNHIRKDLIVGDEWQGTPGRAVEFADGATLLGWDVPAPIVAAGEDVYLEVGWQRRSGGQFRALVFLTDGENLVVREVPPGYDWYMPSRWKRDEVVAGRHALALPDDLPPGTYDLGFLLLGEKDKGVRAARQVPLSALLSPPRYMTGEVRFPGVVRVVSAEEARRVADAGVGDAEVLAGQGRCGEAEGRWRKARHHLGMDNLWQEESEARISTVIARCWARSAPHDQPHDAVPTLIRARSWDPFDAEVIAACGTVADQLQAASAAAKASGDVEAAYVNARDVLALDPTRAWVRRAAEALRDERLGLPERDEEEVEGEQGPPEKE